MITSTTNTRSASADHGVSNMPTDLGTQVRLTNELRDSTELLDYALQLLAVPRPVLSTVDGQRRLIVAANLLLEVTKTLGAPAPGEVSAA